MKKFPLLLILFSILISLGLSAQNYQTVNSGRITYYTTMGEDFMFCRIDSASFIGDSVFYPNRCVGTIPDEDYDCYSPYLFSWMGSKIIIRNDGTNIYFNSNNDSIIIKTRVKLNDNWIAYQKVDSILITAEVVAYDTAMVLGLVDSVKTIRFQAYDSNGEKIKRYWENVTILISKNYGWIKTLDFNSFPTTQSYKLVGINIPGLGILNLTWFDVFDFQVGDILHVEDRFDPCGEDGISRTQKIIYTYLKRSDYADSIVYLIDRKLKENNIVNGEDIFSQLYDTIKSVIVANPEFDKLPREPIFFEDSAYFRMNYQYTTNGQISKTVTENPVFFNSLGDECWYMYYPEGTRGSNFRKGLGGYRFASFFFYPCYKDELELVYYKKGSETWGTPFDFTGVETVVNTKNVNVYPNPASDIICIETNSYNDPVTFELYSSVGNLVIHQIIHSAKQDVDVSSFENGIYFYNVSTADQILKNGKITLLH